jgi:hypothetical protein
MNRRTLALWGALLSVAVLTSVIPGVARTDDVSTLFPVDFGTRIAWYGKLTRIRITGEIHNNSGLAADHLRLVIDELNAKGHVISRVYCFVDTTIPAGGRASFETEVRATQSYRVYLDQFEAPQAPQARKQIRHD